MADLWRLPQRIRLAGGGNLAVVDSMVWAWVALLAAPVGLLIALAIGQRGAPRGPRRRAVAMVAAIPIVVLLAFATWCLYWLYSGQIGE